MIGDALYRNLRPGDRPRLILEVVVVWSTKPVSSSPGSRLASVLLMARLYVLDAGVNLLYTDGTAIRSNSVLQYLARRSTVSSMVRCV